MAEQQQTEVKPFNAVDYMKTANERDAATRAGTLPAKPAEAAPVVEPAKPVEVAKPEPEPHPGRSQGDRRRERQLLREVGELKGQLAAYKEMGKQPVVAADPHAKPERAQFASDAEFTAALVAFQGRQQTMGEQERADREERMEQMTEKCKTDAALFPDWEECRQKFAGDANVILTEHPIFHVLLLESEYRASALHYFAHNPDELEEMLELSGERQIEEFRALEGHLKREYKKLKAAPAKPAEKKEAEPEPKSAAKKEEKLPRPSESVSVRAGSAPPTEVLPYLADGKTMNPAWKEQRNMREGLRR